MRGWCDSVSCQPSALSFMDPAQERKMLCGWEHGPPSRSSEKSPVLGETLSFQPTEGKARHRAREAEVYRNEEPCHQDPTLPLGAVRARLQPPLSLAFSLTGPCWVGGCRASPLLLPVYWPMGLSSGLTGALWLSLTSESSPP